MIDDNRIQQMAERYEMNPSMARKLLQMARAQPDIVRLCRVYEKLREGDTVGDQSNQKTAGQLPEDKKVDPSPGAGTSEHEGRG